MTTSNSAAENSVIVTPDAIFVHRQGGAVIPFALNDATGVAVNISARTVVFRTGTGLEIPLIADPNNTKGLLISLSETVMAGFAAGDTTPFAVVDRSATPDEVLWAGILQVTGF